MSTCATTNTAFVDLGIDDGTDLIEKTHYHLISNDTTPATTSEFGNHLATAFRRAYIRTAAVPLIPAPIDAAIEDATDVVIHRLLDDPHADLRTELIPAFYQTVARTYCAHLETGGSSPDFGIWFTPGPGGYDT